MSLNVSPAEGAVRPSTRSAKQDDGWLRISAEEQEQLIQEILDGPADNPLRRVILTARAMRERASRLT